MNYVFGLTMILWIAIEQVAGQKTDIAGIASTLGALCFFIVKEKYLDRLYASAAYFIGACVLAQYWPPYVLLAAIPIADFAYARRYWLAAPALALAAWLAIASGGSASVLPLLLSGFLGFVLGAKDRDEQKGNEVLDEERRLRYSLEQAQGELIQSRREIESLTETRERNRIAHELHDSIGHGVAGVLMQLEAALRLHRRDADKTEEILRTCTGKLAELLELARNTVYNLKPGVKTGVAALEEIIRGFTYCPVDFRHTGDFSGVSAENMRILEANVTEALTNTARHSHATAAEIRVDIGKSYVRLYYRDNGMGCGEIHESLGLIGMRDRVRNAGGTIAVDGSDGFTIVCNLPERQSAGESGERP